MEAAIGADSAPAVSDAAAATPDRRRCVDVFRGLLIAHMALVTRRWSCADLVLIAVDACWARGRRDRAHEDRLTRCL